MRVAASNAHKMHQLIAIGRGRGLPTEETSARIRLEGLTQIAVLQIEEIRNIIQKKVKA